MPPFSPARRSGRYANRRVLPRIGHLFPSLRERGRVAGRVRVRFRAHDRHAAARTASPLPASSGPPRRARRPSPRAARPRPRRRARRRTPPRGVPHRLREVVVRGGHLRQEVLQPREKRAGGRRSERRLRRRGRGRAGCWFRARADHRAGTSDASAATCSTARSSRLRIEGSRVVAAFGRVVRHTPRRTRRRARVVKLRARICRCESRKISSPVEKTLVLCVGW